MARFLEQIYEEGFLLVHICFNMCKLLQRANVSVDELVGFTGAFAGCAVMLIIPAALVYCSRK